MPGMTRKNRKNVVASRKNRKNLVASRKNRKNRKGNNSVVVGGKRRASRKGRKGSRKMY